MSGAKVRDAGRKKSRKILSKKNPPWWPTAEQKARADAAVVEALARRQARVAKRGES